MHPVTIFLHTLLTHVKVDAMDDYDAASQLHEDLFTNYNKMVLPIYKPGQNLTLYFGSKLISIIDIDEKNQVFTSNLWLELRWTDPNMQWKPSDYYGIKKINVPADDIWTPDIVLYNNAAGDYSISIYQDALVFYDGTVVWQPPAIYKSFCAIDVTWFPYDEQHCDMKFGMWSFTGDYVNMKQIPVEKVTSQVDASGKTRDYLAIGMDLSYYYESAEWDLMNLTSMRFDVVYTSCCGPETYVDIRFFFHLRRKSLFYTVNLISPCVLIALLSVMVFYLPAESGEKITYSISILIGVTMFYLVIIDFLPPTSLVIPLFGKYLLFTLTMVSVSTMLTILVANTHYRDLNTPPLNDRKKYLYLEKLPKYLCFTTVEDNGMLDPQYLMQQLNNEVLVTYHNDPSTYYGSVSMWCGLLDDIQSEILRIKDAPSVSTQMGVDVRLANLKERRATAQVFIRLLENIKTIAAHFDVEATEEEVIGEWSTLATLLDRLFFVIFILTYCVGTGLIIFRAPSIWDTTLPMQKPLDKPGPLTGYNF